MHEGLYELSMQLDHGGAALLCEKSFFYLWHCRLGHLNKNSMSVLCNNRLIKTQSKSNSSNVCDACFVEKSHAFPHSSKRTPYEPLALIFSDIWGPSPIKSHEGFLYYVYIVDAHSNFNWVYPMVHKSDVYRVFEEFLLLAKRQCGRKIHVIYIDY